MHQRRQERLDASAIRFLTIGIQAEGQPALEALVLDTSSLGLAAITVAPEANALELGSSVLLSIHMSGKEHQVAAILRTLQGCGDHIRLGLEFQQNEAPADVDSQFLRHLFERRVAERVSLATESLAASLRDEENELTAQGILLDVSAAGASIELPLEAAIALDNSERVLIDFQLPGTPSLLRLPALIRHRRAGGLACLFALEFEEDTRSLTRFTRDELLTFLSSRILQVRLAG